MLSLYDAVSAAIDTDLQVHALRVSKDGIYASINARCDVLEPYALFGANKGHTARFQKVFDELAIPAQVLGALGPALGKS